MNSMYMGAYGRLRALVGDFLKQNNFDDLYGAGKEEFIPILGTTPYKEEINALYNRYKVPELVEAVINSHAMKNVRNAVKLVPREALPLLNAYMSKWDIENIRLILYSKIRNFDVTGTEAFLVVDRTMPVGTYSGFITREEYANLIAQKNIEDVIELASKYWYGTKLMEAISSIKSIADVDRALLGLDKAYYENLLYRFRYYNGNGGPLYRLFKELTDVRNITLALRFRQNQIPGGIPIAEGGNLSQDTINSLSTSPASEWKAKIPYKIDAAIKISQESKLISFIGTAMLGSVYSKYLPILGRTPPSLEYIFYFIIKTEIERKELLALWSKNYSGLSAEKTALIRMTSYVTI